MGRSASASASYMTSLRPSLSSLLSLNLTATPPRPRRRRLSLTLKLQPTSCPESAAAAAVVPAELKTASDHFAVHGFHHVEFWCSDATNTSRRFSWGLGMPLVAKSDLSTGNSAHASYVIRSGDLSFVFTAPYSASLADLSSAGIPTFSFSDHRAFTSSHGLAVRAVAIQVDSACSAYYAAVSRGAIPVSPPVVFDGVNNHHIQIINHEHK